MLASYSLPVTRDETVKPLLTLDQTYIIFDIDRKDDASEVIRISKAPRVSKIAFRFQTNAPTRYIVQPSSGILTDCNPLPVKIILYGNRYNPNHLLLLQAVEVQGSEDRRNVWQSLKMESRSVYTIRFQLGTTVLGISQILNFDDTESRKVQQGILRVLRLSRKVGAPKVRELESLLEMLKGDEEILKNNVDQTMKIKSIIKAQLEQRKKTSADLTTRLADIERECDALNRKIGEDQAELQKIYDNFRLPAPATK
ncbi:unnamed protein product [Cylicocyclus nassatus]|uniref:Major sperm protein n=1 Tax=Cylicocyclus nassatus TaxID=53992 RepID=A0AA36GPJ5_CYLNA|nr:unnamed protein product [Cylicocyclus nassatus]